MVLLNLRTRQIPHAFSYLLVWQDAGALYEERLAPPPLPTSTVYLNGMGLMAGLPGFASHQCSLHLGAGC